MKPPARPVLRWHGGKWVLAPWIISYFGPHRVYVESYGGAASVLLRKPRSFSEVYNDLDDDVVGLFRVLRDRSEAARLIELLRLTPFGRNEYEAAFEPTDDPVERARRLIVRSYMGFGSDSATAKGISGFRAQAPHSGRSPEKDWGNYPDKLAFAIERLQEVVIECRPAIELMERHDAEHTLHYVDPPYLPATRSTKSRKGGERYHSYAHELSTEDHLELLAFLRTLKGMVILSGYPSEQYDSGLPDWTRVEREALADGARPRREVLWLNPPAAAAVPQRGLWDLAA